MTHQPYIYTMPEQFMADESVPVKWRLYGYINGFWIAGKPVYATNEHFSEKLGCSERHISRALAELQNEGLLLRDVAGFKRYILPGGMTPEVRGGRHGVSAQGDVGGHHISDSSSDSISGASLRIEKDNSDSDKPIRTSGGKKTTPAMEAVFEVFSDNPARKTWKLMVIERESAATLAESYSVDELKNLYSLVRKHRSESLCPDINRPSQMLQKIPSMDRFLKTA